MTLAVNLLQHQYDKKVKKKPMPLANFIEAEKVNAYKN